LVVKTQSGESLLQISCRYILGDPKDTGGFIEEILITVEPAVAFLVKADPSLIKITINPADLRLGDGVFDDNFSIKFSICPFAGNQAITSEIEQPGVDGRLAATRRNQQFVPTRPRKAQSFPCGLGKL